MQRTHLIVALAVALPAQQKARECPFANPSLEASDPSEVAWATTRIDLGNAHDLAPQVRNALARFRRPHTESEEVALFCLLRAVEQWGIAVPPAELRCECPDFARVAWIGAQVRAASEQGNELLALFQSLDAQSDPAWEYVGGAMALRGQRTFAIELRTHERPKLRVVIGAIPSADSLPTPEPVAVPDIDGMPPSPRLRWHRGELGVSLGPGWSAGPVGRGMRAGALPPRTPPAPLDVVYIERAQLRWLAHLAQLQMPTAWSCQFQVAMKQRDLPRLPMLVAEAETRARAALAEADAALRERFHLPERLPLPDLEVVVDDRRSPDEQQATPLPPLK